MNPVLPLIDTHAHLFLQGFAKDLSEVVARARQCGICAVLLPAIDESSIDALIQTWQEYPDFLFPMIGLHPCSVPTKRQGLHHLWNEILMPIAERWRSSWIAIGETGMDGVCDIPLSLQQENLEWHLELASRWHLPLSLHSRGILQKVIDVVRTFRSSHEISGVFHCFTGTYEEAVQILDMGFRLGIGGIVTFRKGGETLRTVLRKLPPDALVLETDAPFLAPVPHRGKRNEPAFLPYILEVVRGLFPGSDIHRLAEQILENTVKTFPLLQKHLSECQEGGVPAPRIVLRHHRGNTTTPTSK